MRLCALLRAILMRLNSLDGRRKRMASVYRYLQALLTSFKEFKVVDDMIVVEIDYKKYAVTREGKVCELKGKTIKELPEVEELEAMKKLEEFILSKAKALASRIGINADRILNPPKKPKKQKPKAEG